MERKIIRMRVSKVHALPGFDDCYLHLRSFPNEGNKRFGWIHLEGWNYPKELRSAKHATVSIEFDEAKKRN